MASTARRQVFRIYVVELTQLHHPSEAIWNADVAGLDEQSIEMGKN